jgi:hypothetical protein
LKNHKQIETQETTHVAGSPLLVEKRIKHSFEDGVYSGRVVSVVPGLKGFLQHVLFPAFQFVCDSSISVHI